MKTKLDIRSLIPMHSVYLRTAIQLSRRERHSIIFSFFAFLWGPNPQLRSAFWGEAFYFWWYSRSIRRDCANSGEIVGSKCLRCGGETSGLDVLLWADLVRGIAWLMVTER